MITKLSNLYRMSFSAKMSQIVKRDIERVHRVQENVMNHQYSIEA